MRDPHPLPDALITPADEVYQVDELSRRLHERLGDHPHDRALPSGRAMRQHPAWRWGRSVDRPSSTTTPQTFSPSDLEQRRPKP